MTGRGGGLAVREWGQRQDSSVVFIHGFMGSSADWEEVAVRLAPRLHIVAVDLPGHGRSAHSGGAVSMGAIVRPLEETLEFLKIGRCGVIGYSFGGRVAMHLALRQPERCEWLVLESASPGISAPGERAARIASDERWAARLEEGLSDALLREWYRQPVFRSLDARPDLVNRLLAMRQSSDARALAAVLRGAGTGRQQPLWNELESLSMPVLSIAGALDAAYVQTANAIGSLVPRGRTAIVPEAGHTVHLEQPEAFAALVAGFFGVSSGRQSDSANGTE